ncbi:hypothetical protein ACWEKM_16195 [Streptomyces sp. NPDC004752]
MQLAEGVAVALGNYTYAGQREKAVDALLDAEQEAKREVLARPRTPDNS